MGGRLVYEAPKQEPLKPHMCDKPQIIWNRGWNYTIGSIWECECGQQWKFRNTLFGDGYPEWKPPFLFRKKFRGYDS